MLSKKNIQGRLRKVEPTEQRFSIRKFTVGAASVLIGMAFMGMSSGQTAHAATVEKTPVVETNKGQTTAEKLETAKAAEGKSAATDQTGKVAETEKATPNSSANESEAASNNIKSNANQNNVVESHNNTAASESKATETKATSSEVKNNEVKPTSETVSTTKLDDADKAFATVTESKANTVPSKDVKNAIANLSNDSAESVNKPNGNVADNQGKQWTGVAKQAIQNESGMWTPQSEYNYTFGPMTVNPSPLTGDVLTGNVIPFTWTDYQAGSNSLSRYKFRLQLDDRLVPYVGSVTMKPNGQIKTDRTLTQIQDNDGKDTNIYEAPAFVVNKGVIAGQNILKSYQSTGAINLKATVQEVLDSISTSKTDPLSYNAYIYDDKNNMSQLETKASGYFVDSSSPATELEESTYKSPIGNKNYIVGSNSIVSYDSTVGDHGAIMVMYQAAKGGTWAYPGAAVTNNKKALHDFNYTIDPQLLPYLSGKEENGIKIYDSEMDIVPDAGGNDGIYKDKATYKEKGYSLPNYDAKNKVADLTFNADGTGKVSVTNKNIKFNNGLPRPFYVRLVYRLSEDPATILKNLGKGQTFTFNNYFTDDQGRILPNSLGTGEAIIDDSDGDLIPNISEDADNTNPLVSMPDVSNVYVSENKVEGQLSFNQNENGTQVVTVKDADGTVLGTTTVDPTKFSGVAQNVPFSVKLDTPAKEGNITVSVEPQFNSDDKNNQSTVRPQETTVEVGAIPTGKTDKTGDYAGKSLSISKLPALTAESGQGADQAGKILDIPADIPTDAVYYWTDGSFDADGKYNEVAVPTFDKDGKTSGKIAVTFPDAYNKDYQHQLLVENADNEGLDFNKVAGDSDKYEPAYKDASVTQGKEVEVPVTYPSDDNDKNINPDNKAPEATTYSTPEATKLPKGVTAKVNKNTGEVTVTAAADATTGPVEIPVTVTYPDGTSDSVTAKVTVDPSDKNEYQPSYKPVDVKKGGSVTTGAPTYTNTDGKDVTAPDGTKYSVPEELPGDVKVSVGSDGKVTVQTSDNTLEGPIEVPVTVTYPDGSTDTVKAPIIVGGTTFVGTDYTVTSYLDLNNIHETTANSMYPDAKSVLKKVVYWNNKDLAQGNTDGHQVSLDDVIVTWTNPINTVVKDASMSATLPGTGTATVSDSNPAVLIKFGPNSQLIKETGNNLYSTSGGQMTAQWYGGAVTMEGAAAKDPSTPIKVFTGINDLTSDQIKALINTTNLDKLTANKPTSYSWATPLKVGDKTGTVRITFSDKDKNGKATYLDVKLPAGSLNVKDPNAQSTITINYVNKADSKTVKSTPVTGKVGDKTNITQASINAGVPENWQVVGGQSITIPNTFGSSDSTLTVYVEHKTEPVSVDKNNKDTYRKVTQTIISKDPTTGKETTVRTTIVPFQRTGVKDMVTGNITWSAWEGPEGSKTVDSQTTYEIPAYTITPMKGYDSYVNGVKNTDNQIPAVSVNADSSNITDTITYIAQNSTPVPYVPGTPGKNDDSNLYVTRTIKYTVPEGQKAIADQTQTVHYVRKDAQGNSGYTDPTTGKTQYVAWTLADGQTAEWPEANVSQIDGYDSLVNGTKAKRVAEQVVTPETQNTTVNVTYTKSDSETPTPHYSENATPKTIVTEKGKMPDPSEGIDNKDDLDPKTTYTWTNGAPDVNKVGEAPVTITVHYPDGNTQNVDTKIIVTGTETPTDPSNKDQSDLFKTVTRTIVTETPNSDGTTTKSQSVQKVVFGRTKTVTIENPKGIYSPYTVYNTDTNKLTNAQTGTLPEYDIHQIAGYTSRVDGKDATTVPAVENVTPETKDTTVNVTYIKNGEQGHIDTDDEENTPQGGTISVPEGHELTPTDAQSAITNNSSLKDVKSYSWDPANTPSTDTPGNKPGTVVVTYNDGSKDNVPVVVNVKSQAETYDPEGQDVHTTIGGDPQPVEGIKNADDMPKGTTYTWTNKPDTSKPGTVSTVVNVIYPDHSIDQVPVKVIIGNPSDDTNKNTDADSNDPQGQTVNTTIGVLPDPVQGIKNADDMPKGTTYTWSGTPDVYTKGNHPGVVKVTYPDKSVDYVPVTVNVTNEPTGKPTTIEQGGQVPDPNTVVDWGDGKEPSNTTITWEKQPDPSKPGDQQGTVKITYPTGQTTTIVVPVTVTPKNPGADDFDPTAKTLDLPYGATVPAAKDQINPDSTNGYTITDAHWTVEPDTKKPGLQLTHISVTGTKDGKTVTKDIPVYVHVGTEADSYDPKGQDFSTSLNSTPAATEGIGNVSDLPSTAKITWALAPNTSTTGVKPSLIKVTYSDGSVDYVPVTVTVTDDNGGNNGDNGNSGNVTTNPSPIAQDIHTPKGVVPDPEDGVKNKGEMPDGTTYTWKETPDVSTEGKHTATIVVTYPDGSHYDVPVTIIVDKDTNDNTGDNNKDTKPEPQPITTDQGKLPDPSEGIKNKGDMPEGTTYTWKKTPDVSKPGTHKVTIVVTYPDGKTTEISTTITVVKAGSEAGTTTGNGSGNNGNGSANMNGNNGSGNNSGVATETGAVSGTNSAEANSANGNGTAKAATKNSEEGKLPQTGASDSSKAGIFGLALAAIAGLFGIAGDRKRKNN